MNKLLPCPFCGCFAEIRLSEKMDHDGKVYPACYVRCSECSSRTIEAFREDDVVAIWNERPDSQRIAELESELKAMEQACDREREQRKSVVRVNQDLARENSRLERENSRLERELAELKRGTPPF